MSQELASTLGIEVTVNTADRCEITVPTERLRQPYGLLHGGVNALLVEHAGSLLAEASAPQGRHAVGTELSISQLAPNASARARAVARPIRKGTSSFTSLVSIYDDAGTLTASGRLTCVYVREN